MSSSNKTKIEIKDIAVLANLKLTPKEESEFENQLKNVVEYISSLNELETENVEPIGHITGLENISREDIASPSLSQEDALKNSSQTFNGFIEVDAVLKEEE